MKDFDKGNLKDDLKSAGFEDCIADDIADRVNDRKADNWSQDAARAEALKEIELMLNRSRQAYDNFRQRNVTSTAGYTSMASGSSTSSTDVM